MLTFTISLRRGSPLNLFKPSMKSTTDIVPPLSGSKSSESLPWSSGLISRSSSAFLTSGRFTNSSSKLDWRSIARTVSSDSDNLLVCDTRPERCSETSIMCLINVVMLVFHRRSSCSRSSFCDFSKAAAAAMVDSTKIAEITLNIPIDTPNTKKQYSTLGTEPYPKWTNSKIGCPPMVLQSPKLHRNVVNMDLGTELKNS
mmetsp:Transcript_19073/g.50608  ORF Transcript_19073/g.50608 Transcript_19073/m.50608 type:complete len:200 (-) Transcript_19073:436-1035(-)